MTPDRPRRRLPRPRTVRSRVTVLATALVAVVLAVSALGLMVVQQRVLTHGIDESLRQRADNIQSAVEQGSFGQRLPNEGDAEDSFLQVLDPDGAVLAWSANAAALPAAGDPLPAGAAQRLTTVDDFPLSEHEFRILARPIRTADGDGTLVVAKNLDDVHESVTILAASLATAIPLVTGLLGLLVWWLTGRVLRPVEVMRGEVASIRGDQLQRRLPTPESDDEIARLARTMNAMLERVDQATARQRRFVADASHELRSPLTRIRAGLEVGLAHPHGTDPRDLYRSLLSDTVDLQKLVDDLLFLARSESGALVVPDAPVDLDDLVLEEAARLRQSAAPDIDISGVSAARTRGDRDQLGRMIRNLASNAERHARSRVSFTLEEHDDVCRLEVADDGDGIAPEHREVIFTRFARLDEARSRDAGGFGLGLAIVHDIVARHAGRIEIADEPGPGARFVVTLPRTD